MLETPLGEIAVQGRRLPRDSARHPAPVSLQPGAAEVPGHREHRLRAHAEAVSQRARAAHGDVAVLGARHPAAREPADDRREGRVPAGGEEGEPAVRDDRWSITRSIWSGGTASTIRGRSASTTSSRASAASTCRRPCTRRSRATASSSARSARGRTTSIPSAVPVPYNHSNVMSDEVIYYASSEFMSRKGIEYGSMTLHPDGIPHGPHPGPHGSVARRDAAPTNWR